MDFKSFLLLLLLSAAPQQSIFSAIFNHNSSTKTETREKQIIRCIKYSIAASILVAITIRAFYAEQKNMWKINFENNLIWGQTISILGFLK